MNSYIFIVNDLQIGIEKVSHKEIIKTLFKKNEWIFPEKGVSNLKKIKDGDRVLLYIAGKENRYFYGGFSLSGKLSELETYKNDFYKFFKQRIGLKDTMKFSKKIFMKDIKDSLEFIKDKKNYGLHLRQSIRKISDKDYNYILEECIK